MLFFLVLNSYFEVFAFVRHWIDDRKLGDGEMGNNIQQRYPGGCQTGCGSWDNPEATRKFLLLLGALSECALD